MGQVSPRLGVHVEIRDTKELLISAWNSQSEMDISRTINLYVNYHSRFLLSVLLISKNVFPVDGDIAASCSFHFFGSLFLCICI